MDEGLLDVGGPVGRPWLQGAAFHLDLFGPAGVLLADPRVDDAAVVRQVGEVPAGAEQQRSVEGAREGALRALDAAVLVGDAAVVAARHHAVMAAPILVAAGQILGGIPVQVAERR